MKVLFIFSNSRFIPHIEYVFEHAARILGIKDFSIRLSADLKPDESADIVIFYGRTPPPLKSPLIHIRESDFFGVNYLSPESLPALPLEESNGMPILFGKKPESGDWVLDAEKRIFSHMDLVAGIFFLLTRCEEILIKEKDRYGRFPAQASLLTKAGFLQRPLADEYVEILGAWMSKLIPAYKWHYPLGDHPFCLYVTHDVDAMKKYTWKGVLGFGQSFLEGIPFIPEAVPFFERRWIPVGRRNGSLTPS